MKRKKKSTQKPLNLIPSKSEQLAAFQPMLSAEEFSALQIEVEKALPPAIRINPLKAPADLAKALSKRYGWTLTPIPFWAEGYRVQVNDGPAVSAALEHRIGQYYIQEAASMLPVALFDIHTEEKGLTLDLAASPGGKTTHIVACQNDRGLVLANDSSQGRIQALKVVLQHWGATNTAVTRFAGEKFGGWFPNTFDRALIDAPCSMQGLRTAESHDERPVTDKESRLLAQRQTALLVSALQAVKIGGQVVYSTCTLLPGEDEGVVEAVLSKLGNAVQLVDASPKLPQPAPGIQQLDGQPYQADMSRVVRLWPHRYQTAGFFACLLQKTADLDLKTMEPPTHSMEAAGFNELSYSESEKFARDFMSWTGYDLSKYLQEHQRTVVKRDARLFLFPRLLLEQFRSLPVQSAGMLLGEWEG
ncbi:RsmB/NOP family class I SAM-dependent RNA methyltransferase, partial [bacterium]|nr:RsmB/NOP family class I SAM-dependent RNA methyltransferase [bacterium]